MITSRRHVLEVVALAMMAALSVGQPATARGDSIPVIDVVERDCTQIPPDEVPPPALSTEDVLELDVRVLFERGDKATVKDHMRTTEFAFERIGIEIVATYDRLEIPESWNTGGGLSPDAGSDEHWGLMKDHYGGTRPTGVDVVYFFTRYWGGGMADCIGGVALPQRAFAFGSFDYAIEGIVPVPTVDEGVIAAHEIGHLLGAHHHYSNCVEAPARGAVEGQAAPCTTMSPAAVTASAFFGLMESSFVRYYTAEYAQD